MAYQLQSKLFTKDDAIRRRLQRIAEENSAHVQQGSAEDCVAVIQQALFLLVPDLQLPNDELAGKFGGKTAEAVYKFKRTPDLNGTGKKILGPGQTDCDRIVGIQTIEALDRMLAKKQPGDGPKPDALKKRQDVVIWIQGAGVGMHGRPDAADAMTLGARIAAAIGANRSAYEQKYVFPPLVIAVFGAPRDSGANPESNIRAAVTAIRKAGNFDIGRVCIWGSSIGGPNAMHLSAALHADRIPQALLGLGDAAFPYFAHYREERSRDGRTIMVFDKPPGMQAASMSSTFQTWGNELTTVFGTVAEWHGGVQGVPHNDVSGQPRIKSQWDRWVAEGRPGGERKNRLWLGMHDAAVALGEQKFLSEMLGILANF